ncbi:hypothetical protein LCGC14_2568850 [marine sediment metagenome]|uniref:Uncharacterized protein n=1 Tax=marine sediment metagenome TaxID=412755 RepID=A0A0F9CTW5_9ZZZZ
MNWLVTQLIKEARDRRFNINDKVRYFTDKLKGKGKGVVLTPSFTKGTVVDFDNEARRYRVKNDRDEMIDVHPRNIIPDSIHAPAVNIPKALPAMTVPDIV